MVVVVVAVVVVGEEEGGEEIIPGLFIINEPSIHRWSKQVDTIINLQKHNYSFGIILRTYFTFFLNPFLRHSSFVL